MNFTTSFSPSPDGAYGILQSNGSWNGIIQSIIMNKTEVGVVDVYYTLSRSEAVDFSPSIMEEKDRMFIKSPRSKAFWGPQGVFAKPFTPGLWFVCLTMVICLQLVLF